MQKDKGMLSKCAKILNIMTDWAVHRGLISSPDDMRNMPLTQRDRIFSDSFVNLSEVVLDVHTTRPGIR